MQMQARRHRMPRRQASEAMAGGGVKQGYTLLEMGFVIVVMGLLILLMSNHFLEQSRRIIPQAQPSHAQLADQVVRDVRRITRAAQLWASRHGGVWPHKNGVLDLAALGPDGAGYMPEVPTLRGFGFCDSFSSSNRKCRCGASSRDPLKYYLLAYDRTNKTKRTGATAKHTDDLVISFCIRGDDALAESIVSRIPFGVNEKWGINTAVGLVEYDMEMRVMRGSGTLSSTDYVRETGEDRPIVAKHIALQEVDEAYYDADTKIKLDGAKDVSAGVWNNTYVHNAYFDLTTHSLGAITSAKPIWKIKDLHNSGSNRYEAEWTLAEIERQTVGTSTTYAPSVSVKVAKDGTTQADMTWAIEYSPQTSTTTGTDPAFFDLRLTRESVTGSSDSNADGCHRGIHVQLCEIEREVHRILDAATLPGTKPYTFTSLEDPACPGSLPPCP